MKQFFTFEGIDGSGKSTIAKLVCKKLKQNGYDSVFTFEPTGSYFGKHVQKCIEGDADPFVTTFAFIADRVDHCKQIQKWLDEGKIVICDRYSDSTYAYQAVQLEKIVKDPMKWLNTLSENIIIKPDEKFLFLIEPKESLARIQDRENLISFEKQDFLEKVSNNYKLLAKQEDFIILDATQTIDELVDICYKKILEK